MVLYSLFKVGDLVVYRTEDGVTKDARVVRVFVELHPHNGRTAYLLDNDTIVDEEGTLMRERRRMLEDIGARISEMGNGHE